MVSGAPSVNHRLPTPTLTPARRVATSRRGRALVRRTLCAIGGLVIGAVPAAAQQGEPLPSAGSPTETGELPAPTDGSPAASAETPPTAERGTAPAAPPSEDALEILGEFVEPGRVARLVLLSSESFAGVRLETPVIVAHGAQEGPTLCVIAGIHGDEVNGVEVVRRLVLGIDVEQLAGAVIAVPIANPSAFLRGSRYLLDRRDLNRYFPGRPEGSSASRIAHRFFEGVVRQCDGLIDLHTGSFKRTNLHQLRADLSHEPTASLAASYGARVVVNSAGRRGTLRRAARDIDVAAITVEAGFPGLFDEEQVAKALDGIAHLLSARGMSLAPEMRAPRPETTAYLRTRWVRGDQGGILVSKIRLGDHVEKGQVLGTISDPLSDEVDSIEAPLAGRVIGMALDQLVMPGFAAYHIGFEPRPLGSRIPAVAGDAEEALDGQPDGVELEDRPE